MSTIRLDLSIEDTNLILKALGEQPYVKVYELIARIQSQAAPQVQSPTSAETASDAPQAAQ
jgi:hypothetical protein